MNRHVQGTYTNAFLILAVLNFLGAVLFWMAKPSEPRAATTQAVATQAGC